VNQRFYDNHKDFLMLDKLAQPLNMGEIINLKAQ